MQLTAVCLMRTVANLSLRVCGWTGARVFALLWLLKVRDLVHLLQTQRYSRVLCDATGCDVSF